MTPRAATRRRGLGRRRSALCAALLLTAIGADPATANDGPVPALPGALSQAQAAVLIENMAWTVPVAANAVRTLTFAADGTGTAARTGTAASTFAWTLGADGRLCLTPAADGMAGCVYLRRTETALLLIDPNGNLQGEVSTIRVE